MGLTWALAGGRPPPVKVTGVLGGLGWQGVVERLHSHPTSLCKPIPGTYKVLGLGLQMLVEWPWA